MTECQANCHHLIRASSYTETAATFNINTNFIATGLCNGNRYRLVLCAKLPSMKNILPATIIMGGVSYPLMDIIGNNLMNDQLRTRKVYEIILGTKPNHFILDECVRTSCGN